LKSRNPVIFLNKASHSYKLQVRSIEFHITDLFDYNPFYLVAILLLFLLALLHRMIFASKALLHGALWLDRFLLALVANLSWLLLAILGVAVFLGLLGTSFHFQFTDFLGLEVAVLFLDGEGEGVGELLTIPMDVSLAHFDLNLSWDVITVLLGFSSTNNLLLAITVRISGLLASAVEFYSIRAGNVIDHLLFHIAVRCLDIAALVIILGSGINLVGCVTNTILSSETPLNLISLLQSLIMNGLY